MSQFKDYRGGSGFEMNHFSAQDSDPIYYNSIPGQRPAISLTNSDYEFVPNSYEASLSQESDSYVNTLIRQPGEKPIFGCEYEDTITIQKLRQPPTVAPIPPTVVPIPPTIAPIPPTDKYHDYEDNLLAKARDQCRREGYDYEDVPDPVRHQPSILKAPSKTQVQEDDPVRPMKKEVKFKDSKRYGACCVRGLVLWSVLLLMLVITAAVFIGLQQVRINTFEQRCNVTVPFSFTTF